MFEQNFSSEDELLENTSEAKELKDPQKLFDTLSYCCGADGSPRFGLEKDVDELKMEIEKVKNEMAHELGNLLHDQWRAPRKKDDGTFEPRIKKTNDKSWIEDHGGEGEVDIANTSFGELPEDWQKESRESAKVAMEEVFTKAKYGPQFDDSFIEEASAIVHQKWVERNSDRASEDQNLPYENLSEEEKDKDRAIVREAVRFFQSRNE